MLWLILPPAAATAATVPLSTVLLAAAATVCLATVIACAGKKKEPKILANIADDQTEADSSMISKPSSSHSSNGASDQSLKPRKQKSDLDLSKKWNEGKTIHMDADDSDPEQDPKLIVPKTERSCKKPKQITFPPAKLFPAKPDAPAKRPLLSAQQPPSSGSGSDSAEGQPDKPMAAPVPDDGVYQCLGGLDESKKKTARRVPRPPAAHEAVPRGRTPMSQPSPIGTPAAVPQPPAARRVAPAAAAAAAAKPQKQQLQQAPVVEDYDPAAKTAGTDVSLLADRVAPQEQTPVAPSPAPRAIAPLPAASAPGTPIRAPARTPAAPPLVLPAVSPCAKANKTQEKTQADSPPMRGKV